MCFGVKCLPTSLDSPPPPPSLSLSLSLSCPPAPSPPEGKETRNQSVIAKDKQSTRWVTAALRLARLLSPPVLISPPSSPQPPPPPRHTHTHISPISSPGAASADRLVGLVVKVSAPRVEDPEFDYCLPVGISPGRVIPVT